jgi:outer membrane protein assembly factor BamB
MSARIALVTLTLLLATLRSNAADWPAFRGPAGNGLSPETDVPTRWSAEENIAWKAKLPRPGNGSPIVVGNRVFVTSAEDAEGKKRSLYCFDAASGKERWVRTVTVDQAFPTHETNPYAGTTPACDGKRVVVWHASGGLFCYDLEGNEQWSRNLGEFRHMWGYGTSPVIYKDRVLLHTGPGKRVFVTAIGLADGQTRWETVEPLEGEIDRNPAGKYMGSWATPLVITVEGKDQVLVTMPTRLCAYDPDSGSLLWWCGGVPHEGGDLAYSSPVIAGDLCVVTGGFSGPSFAVRLGGSGDVTETHRLWRTEKSPQSIGSAVVIDGFVYRPNAGPGTIQCLRPLSGEILWTDRAVGNNHWGSIVSAGGLLYATDQSGTTVVFKPNPTKYDEVARNPLGEHTNTTPAIARGRIFIRTDASLVCVGG